MKTEIVQNITKGPVRKSLYHFTRVNNLASIADSNTLYASNVIHPNPKGERRSDKERYQINGNTAILNAHLKISTEMMDIDTTISQFRSFLDQHVFLWPTLRLCKQMLYMYSRREPLEKFAVLQLDACPLLSDHYDQVLLSKYDAGSMPRYPKRTSYRKTLRMFLPLGEFRKREDSLVPRIPSQIHEIMIHHSVLSLHSYLQAVYCAETKDVPKSWVHLHRSLEDIQLPTGQD
ncbi:hypothetical protein [Paenibacillus sp. GD4]|jgi:hypothetical protein|uniref:DUF7002 family protein n=1 Tax=Paenibacillus sp. GD4 TaxID=3068890 RepID=UPI00358FB821